MNGTYRKDRHGDPSTKPKWGDTAPEPPSGLDDVAIDEWNRVMSVVPAGVITDVDRCILTQYCVLWARMMADPPGFPDSGHTQLKQLAQQMGFTPVFRSKVHGPPKNEKGRALKTAG